MSGPVSPVELLDDVEWAPGALHVIRSICTHLPGSLDGGTVPSSLDGGSFTLHLAEVDSEVEDPADIPSLALVGEVQISNTASSHFIAVTAVLLVHYPAGVPEVANDAVYAEHLRRIGRWGCHIVWDFAASQIRSLAAPLMQPELAMPEVTPEPRLLRLNGDGLLKSADVSDET